jgi:hypothetical protein
VSALMDLTVAPGTTAPCGSITVPEMEPLETWAEAPAQRPSTTNASRKTTQLLRKADDISIAPRFILEI